MYEQYLYIQSDSLERVVAKVLPVVIVRLIHRGCDANDAP